MSVSAVAAALGLPGEVVLHEQVGGAWSNRLHRVVTSEGQFAVKELLNPWNDAHWLDWLHEASAFEQTCLDAGVTAPAIHRDPNGSVMSQWCGRRFRVHRWIADGQPCPPGPVTERVAEATGHDLAVMHGLRWTPRRRHVFPRVSSMSAREWPELVRALEPSAPELATAAAEVTPAVEVVAGWLDEPQDATPTVMSHGDLDPKNLVLAGASWIVDWDVAAPWPPVEEVARSALSLADWSDPSIAKRFIASYVDRSGHRLTFDHTSLTTDLLIGLDWLSRCLRRASGIEPCSEDRRSEAQQQARAQLEALPSRVAITSNLDDWLSL